MIIAVDFDGTIVEHKYPAIGKEIPLATVTLRQLIKDGHKLILWTVRKNELLDDAVKWCEERGIHFYAVNQDIDEDAKDHQGLHCFSRKPKAHIFIDDRNVGGLPDWGTIYQLISRKMTLENYLKSQSHEECKPTKKSWWPF